MPGLEEFGVQSNVVVAPPASSYELFVPLERSSSALVKGLVPFFLFPTLDCTGCSHVKLSNQGVSIFNKSRHGYLPKPTLKPPLQSLKGFGQ